MSNDGMGQDAVGKHIINSNLHISNLMDLKEESNKQLFIATLDNIADILKPHCGPHSQFGMIISDTTSSRGGFIAPNTFTKDGIKLLETVEFASLIQTYLKNTITYIGREVDRRAKDGTTTAMILSSLFLKYCIADKEEVQKLNMTTSEYDKCYRELVKILNESIEEYSYNLDSFMQMYPGKDKKYWAGVIAFMQAMSSSGGNIDLALCMRQIFGQITEDCWGIQSWYTSQLETDKQYSIKIEDFDYSLSVDFQNMAIYNSVMQTEWVENDVTVACIPDSIISKVAWYQSFTNYIEKFPEDKSLCVVVMHACPELIKLVADLNIKRTKPIALAVYFTKEKQFSTVCADLAGLCAMASIHPYYRNEIQNDFSDKYTFKVDKIRSYGSTMEFFGIFDHTPGVTTVHPNFLDPEKCPYYTEFLNDLRRYADVSNASINKDQDIADKVTSLIRKISVVHLPTLILGGTTHDIIANKLVAQDVIGATMASLKNKFFINGTLTMRDVIHHVQNKINKDEYIVAEYEKKYMNYILLKFEKAIEEIITILYYKNIYGRSNSMGLNIPHCKPGEYVNAIAAHGAICDLDMFVGFMEVEESLDVEVLSDYPVLQPVAIYQEILNRVGELLIKLMSTDKVIVPGGAFVNR